MSFEFLSARGRNYDDRGCLIWPTNHKPHISSRAHVQAYRCSWGSRNRQSIHISHSD